MDLGLSALTDDQLLELLKQACAELAERDPFCRNLAQLGITDAADTLQLKRDTLKKAVLEERAKYIQQIEADVLKMVRQGVADGTVRLLTPAQEGRIIAEADIVARIKCIDETAAAIQQGALGKKRAERTAWEATNKRPPSLDWEVPDPIRPGTDYLARQFAQELDRDQHMEDIRTARAKQSAYEAARTIFYTPKVKP